MDLNSIINYNSVQDNIEFILNEKKLECSICNKIFLNNQLFFDHMNSHHEILSFYCHICNKSYKMEASLRNHLNKSHDIKLK